MKTGVVPGIFLPRPLQPFPHRCCLVSQRRLKSLRAVLFISRMDSGILRYLCGDRPLAGSRAISASPAARSALSPSFASSILSRQCSLLFLWEAQTLSSRFLATERSLSQTLRNVAGSLSFREPASYLRFFCFFPNSSKTKTKIQQKNQCCPRPFTHSPPVFLGSLLCKPCPAYQLWGLHL